MAHYFLFSFFKLSESAWYQRKANIPDGAQWYRWDGAARKYYHSHAQRLRLAASCRTARPACDRCIRAIASA